MNFSPNIITANGPWLLMVFGVFILLEIFWNYKKQKGVYNLKETGANLFIMGGMQVAKLGFVSWQLFLYNNTLNFQLFKIESSPLSWVAAFLVTDFLYYWHHRALHEIKALWTLHFVHHSSPWMNLTTSFRLNWFAPLVGPFFYLPAVLLGFSPGMIIVSLSINLVYQFWLHTESIGKLGFLEKFLNTPSNHRVHHGSNEIYLDKNYAGVLIIWDRLFGTYEVEEQKVIYGVTTGFLGHNPVRHIFQGFADYARGKMSYRG